MKRFPGNSSRLSTCLAAMMLLAACGGGSSDSPPTNDPGPIGNNPPPQPAIQGVATPSTVSVVTATNAD